jgi:hypothetical protein
MNTDKHDQEILTVAELIERLQKMPSDAVVYHEGCDCYGAANDVVLDEDGTVLITRSN